MFSLKPGEQSLMKSIIGLSFCSAHFHSQCDYSFYMHTLYMYTALFFLIEYNTLSSCPCIIHYLKLLLDTLAMFSLVMSCWTYRVQTAHVNSFSAS